MQHILNKIYAVIGYVVSMAALTYYFGWLSGFLVPVSIDGPALVNIAGDSLLTTFLVNIVLMSIFMVPHSVMARPRFKKIWLQVVPEPIERSTYIWYSALSLFLMMLVWQPIKGMLWEIPGVVEGMVYGLFLVGVLVLVVATFCIDHFDLFGLKQAFTDPQKKTAPPAFVKRWLYSIVRHPIALGLIIITWATPAMSLGHLLYAVFSSIYIFYVTFKLEERDLLAVIGEEYRIYQKATPAIFPMRIKK